MRATIAHALIAAGYVLAVVGGMAAVALNELAISENIQQTSGGMVAFGDMVLFVFVTAVLSLLPTWFLLKLWVRASPRSLITVELALAALGPVSWLAMAFVASGGPHPQAWPVALLWLGPLIAFVAIPRIVAGPAMIAIETATIFLIEARRTRRLLGLAIVAEFVPIALFTAHLGRAALLGAG
jgi:hypothetical protein